RALTAGNLGDVMCDRLHLGPRVRRRDCQTYAPHHHYVGEIVADVRHFAGVDGGVGQDLLDDRDLLGVALVDVFELALSGAPHRGWGDAPADESGDDAQPRQPLQADAVLRIEAFGLGHRAVRSGDVIQLAVGENTVDIHQQ